MTPPTSTWRNSYTGYSVGSAGVWTLIMLVAERRLDPEPRRMLQLVCGGWWLGWVSASIARVAYPSPKPLSTAAEKRLRTVSIALIALGLVNTARFLLTGRRTPDAPTP